MLKLPFLVMLSRRNATPMRQMEMMAILGIRTLSCLVCSAEMLSSFPAILTCSAFGE